MLKKNAVRDNNGKQKSKDQCCLAAGSAVKLNSDDNDNDDNDYSIIVRTQL